MSGPRVILEMGAGADLHGGDSTKAAVRAVRDALQHSSLVFLRVLDIDPASLTVEVTIGVSHPESVDTEAVKREFPVGRVSVRAVRGGLDVPDETGGDRVVIAGAAVEVRLPAPAE